MDDNPEAMVELHHGPPMPSTSRETHLSSLKKALVSAPLRTITQLLKGKAPGARDQTEEDSARNSHRVCNDGNLFMVKLLQFSMKNIACTLVTRTNQAPLGILKHSINLFPGILDKKTDLTQVWILREVGEKPSPTWFDLRTNPFPITNIIT